MEKILQLLAEPVLKIFTVIAAELQFRAIH